jgi:hypothetical protein
MAGAKLIESLLARLVITHMAPSKRSVASEYASDLGPSAFALDLD